MTRDELAKAAAPIVPAETCPMIDPLSVLLSAIGCDLETFADGLDSSRRKTVAVDEVKELILDQRGNLASARRQLEDIRTANEQLRDSGRYWRGVAKGANEMLEDVLRAVGPFEHRLPAATAELLGRAREAA